MHSSSIPTARRDWVLFSALTFCFAFGFAVYGGIFQNYIREVLHAGPEKLGTLESLREVPGLLTAFTAGILASLAETRLAGVALIVCALGVGLTGQTSHYWTLVAITAFWSVGAHLWFSVSPAITLSLARGREGGKYLGRMTGVGSFAVLLALGFTWFAKSNMSYDSLFKLSGILIFAGAICGLNIRHRALGGARIRLLYRSEYRLYYMITFLEGCRRQIFGTFASFVLIVVFKQDVQTILALSFINAVITMIAGPIFGKWIDRYGERKLMSIYYTSLIFVFAGYALCSRIQVLYGLYILDSLLFCFGMGITTFLHRIARTADLTPSLAMGTTMNHIAAVVVPVTGGILWKTTGNYQIPFFIGIAVVICSLIATQYIPRANLLPERIPLAID